VGRFEKREGEVPAMRAGVDSGGEHSRKAQSKNASIIIPVYNRTDDLLKLLAQLKVQNRNDFELVVVDDGSCPPVSESLIVSNYPFPVLLIRHHDQRGIAAARNTGIASSSGELVVFIDSDACVADPDWYEKHMRLYRRAEDMARKKNKTSYVFHSEVYGISESYIGRVDTYANWLGSCMKKACLIRDRHVPMNNTSMHRSVFSAVGMFDEEFRISEDIEWGFRCLSHGVALIYVPGAPVGHYDRNTVGGVWDHYYRFGQYTPKVRARHPDAPRSWLYPKNIFQAVILFLPLTFLKTIYILMQWIPQSPWVFLYTPGIYLANVASFWGMCKTLRAIGCRKRQKHISR